MINNIPSYKTVIKNTTHVEVKRISMLLHKNVVYVWISFVWNKIYWKYFKTIGISI